MGETTLYGLRHGRLPTLTHGPGSKCRAAASPPGAPASRATPPGRARRSQQGPRAITPPRAGHHRAAPASAQEKAATHAPNRAQPGRPAPAPGITGAAPAERRHDATFTLAPEHGRDSAPSPARHASGTGRPSGGRAARGRAAQETHPRAAAVGTVRETNRPSCWPDALSRYWWTTGRGCLQTDVVPATSYARSEQVNIAYQAFGDGPLDLVFVPGFISHIELAWEEPYLARFLRRLPLSPA